MAHNSRAGRPPKAGPRYISGRLRPNHNPRASLVLAHRARQAVARGLLDPKWASELELLGPAFAGELTHAQVDAGHLVARIYGQYERLKGVIPRTPAGPSYVRMIASDRLPLATMVPAGGLSEKIMRLEDDEEQLRRAEKAIERWDRLQAIIDELPFPPETVRRARDLLEQLCVQNLPIRAEHLHGMRDLLDFIGRKFGRKTARGSGPRPNPSSSSVAITSRRPPRNQRRPAGRPDDPRTLHEHALIDRERFRAEKRRRA